MKIMILTNHSYMLYQFRRELIQALLQENEVHISVPFGDRIEELRQMGCHMIDTPLDRRGINPFTDLSLFVNYYRLLKQEKPDMVITYSIKPNIYGGMICRLLKIPYSVNVQGLGTAFQKKGLAAMVTCLYKTALKKAKVVLFENKANRAEFCSRKIVKPQQTAVLPGAGVNLEYYAYQPYKEEDGVHFLYLGRLMKEKGVDEFFQAAKRIKEKYGDKVVFDVVGFFEDEYKTTVEELQKQNIIVFHGFQTETRPFYAKASCVVLPSWHEGMSNVLLEAASVGRALITSDIPGCREAADDGVSGFLCRVKDAQSVYDNMEKFMDLDAAAREQMGKAGRKKMEEVFDKRHVVAKTVELLRG